MQSIEKIESEEQWDKKKIVIALCFVVISLAGGAYLVKNDILGSSNEVGSEEVQGANTSKENVGKGLDKGLSIDAYSPLKTVIEDKLGELKKEIDNLNVAEVATASPQIQKIIKDFDSLKAYPVNEAKDICRQICGL